MSTWRYRLADRNGLIKTCPLSNDMSLEKCKKCKHYNSANLMSEVERPEGVFCEKLK